MEKAVFFKGINGLRFIAAFAVIVTHIELLKGHFGFKHHWDEPMVFNAGGLGVYFFFVLSGFLITYLLLVEKSRFGEINILKFYVRRMLRIWPLYYLIVIIGFFILPLFPAIQIPYLQGSFIENYYPNLFLYLLILPNLAFALYPAVPHIGQLWSIGVEEQFYIFWPWLIARSRNIVRTLIIVIVVLIFIKVIVLILGHRFAQETWYGPLKLFVAMSKFECMAIGGLGAYYLFNQSTWLDWIYKSLTIFFVLLLIPVLVYFTPPFLQDGIHIIFAGLFLILILYVVKHGVWLERPLFSYLGKISYGIYMYHFMIIPIILYTIKSSQWQLSNIALNLIIYISVVMCTIVISGLSYWLYEKKFIKMKHGFALVKSGTSQ